MGTVAALAAHSGSTAAVARRHPLPRRPVFFDPDAKKSHTEWKSKVWVEGAIQIGVSRCSSARCSYGNLV
jgi:hypothetical protein